MSPQAGAHDARAQRFFFALRPDPQAAAALAGLAVRLAAQVGGRPLAAVDLHLTLAFVGARNAADTARLADMLDGLLPAVQAAQPPCIPFALSQLGAFGPKLLWIGPAQPIDWVQALSDGLRRRLTEAGVDHDERPLRAHLTLLRGARRATAARGTVAPIAPAGWTLCLGWSGLDSTPQRRYQWHCHDTVKLAS
ncbi:MAG: hypothetical protein J0H09_15775 [Burkholderiales bacterium]|nr:hypothetical protein [Burkholderiales bacterium]